MDCKRDEIIKLISYIESQGIEVNFQKNKARGNKGLFFVKNNNFRIDISQSVEDSEILRILLHEFTHFLHYKYDKNLKFPTFIFGNECDEIREELINVTVKSIPKNLAQSLFDNKNQLNNEILDISSRLKQVYPDFKLTSSLKKIEKSYATPVKYLLKYDKINYFGNIYSLDNIKEQFKLSEEGMLYLLLKSKQRMLRRINSKISRLNRYYNEPSELFARFSELFFTDINMAKKNAPSASALFWNKIQNEENFEFNEIYKILTNT